ncbi:MULTISPECIES: replication-relaxation family protein [Streptomyces]|uniref:Replication-relaxation family protein n=1 Tax=Streptomyces silvae TaxID=2803812 RepID=A0ABU7ZV00_9ACTN|nr:MULTISPECIES: replication-relaxation family protein [unclassified Streptomyces]MDX3328208.1 replication-relaxation family protein [Streptomyces sp. ME02-6979-3A]MDX3688589.1 replication-relaxation family protein [Streptomyces sp. AK04-4c]
MERGWVRAVRLLKYRNDRVPPAVAVPAHLGHVTNRRSTLEGLPEPTIKSLKETWKPTHTRKKEVLKALGIFQRATAEHLWRMLRPGDSHDRCTRDTLNALKGEGKVRVETRLESNHQLWVLTERGHKEAKQLLPGNVRVSALRKLEFDDDGEPVAGEGFDEHAAAVTLTAAVLTGAGSGTPLSWQTEIAHRLPYGYTRYAELTMRAPYVDVPAMLLEVDRVKEPVDVLVDKARRYTEWFELLAPKADKVKAHAAGHHGAAVHDFRLWARIYPATGREGYVPVAFVFTGRTKAQRASRMPRLEQAARSYFAGTQYAGGDITAVDFHQALPVAAFGGGADVRGEVAQVFSAGPAVGRVHGLDHFVGDVTGAQFPHRPTLGDSPR